MKIEDYLKEEGIIKKRFAEKVGITPTALHHYIARRRKPSLDVMLKITKATRGKVTIKDFAD